MNRKITLTLLALLAPVAGSFAQSLKPQDDPVFLKKAALQIDQHIASFYRSKNLAVPKVTDDATFLRRAFLVSIGRIPTAEEALAFLEIEDPTKRESLVDYLLKSQRLLQPHDELGLRSAAAHRRPHRFVRRPTNPTATGFAPR